MQPFVYESAVFNLTFHFTQLNKECNRLHKIFSFFLKSLFSFKKTASMRDSFARFSLLFIWIFTKRRIRFMSLEYIAPTIIESCIRFVDDERVPTLSNLFMGMVHFIR